MNCWQTSPPLTSPGTSSGAPHAPCLEAQGSSATKMIELRKMLIFTSTSQYEWYINLSICKCHFCCFLYTCRYQRTCMGQYAHVHRQPYIQNVWPITFRITFRMGCLFRPCFKLYFTRDGPHDGLVHKWCPRADEFHCESSYHNCYIWEGPLVPKRWLILIIGEKKTTKQIREVGTISCIRL